MRHPSGGRQPTTRLRTVRADGTPVYRYESRPGAAPVTVARFAAGSHDPQPPEHQHIHDFLVLVYVEQGDGASVRIGEADVPLHDGTLCAIGPGQVLGVGRQTGNSLDADVWVAYFMPDAATALAGLSPLAWSCHPLAAPFAAEPSTVVVPPSDRARWSGWFAELAAEAAAPERVGAQEATSATLTRMLVAQARLWEGVDGPAVDDRLAAAVFDLIERRFAEPVTAAEIAREAGYTPGHLTTVLRQRTGRTLHGWLTERRMTEVRRLLVETDLPLSAITAQTGYRDGGYLSRRFRERYGTTPVQWRTERRARDR